MSDLSWIQRSQEEGLLAELKHAKELLRTYDEASLKLKERIAEEADVIAGSVGEIRRLLERFSGREG